MKNSQVYLVALVTLLLLAASSLCLAQAVTVADVVSFGKNGLAHPGATPLQGRGGLLYEPMPPGISTNGYVVTISASGATRIIYKFTDPKNGESPISLLLASDGNFYGTTFGGGNPPAGVLFKVTAKGTFTLLHTFGGADGIGPRSLIEASDGNLYGVTYGGTQSSTVFKYSGSGVFSTLYTVDVAHGFETYSLLQGSDGDLLVTSWAGGSSNNGSIFKLSLSGKLIRTYSFPGGLGGSVPYGMIQAPDGNYYGVTAYGGQPTGNGTGTVFRYTPGGKVTVIYAFDPSGVNGITPYGLVAANDGYLYGTTAQGGANGTGGIFRISTSGALQFLYSANLAIGEPYGVPTQSTNGLLYASAPYGGPTNNGTYESGYGAIVSINAGLRPFVKLVQTSRKVGQSAQILGQGLKGATAVTFHGVPATRFTVVSDTYMTAMVPPGAKSGPVVVTTPTGTLTSYPNFVLHK